MSNPICMIQGCENESQTRRHQLCSKHYSRLRRTGDPVKTTRIPHGTAQRFYQERVLTHYEDECLIWPYAKTLGYGVLGNKRVPALICEDTHGKRPSKIHQAAHECGNPSCVARKHLTWKTPLENNADKFRHGTVRRGRENGSILTESDIREIRKMRGKLSRRAIADIYGVKPPTIGNIFNGSCWSWVED